MGRQTTASRKAPRAALISVFKGRSVPGVYLLSGFKKKPQLCFIPQEFAKFPAFPETSFPVASREHLGRGYGSL